MSIVLNVFNGDDEKELLGYLFESISLVQDDYLGGSGTRGSGQVKFSVQKLSYKDKKIYDENEDILENLAYPPCDTRV